jgi:multidrug efflux system outer membrane protein
MRTPKFIPLAMLAALAGCTMIPEYERPEPPVPAAFPADAAAAVEAAPLAPEVAWKDYFTDPRLQAVIEMALANNRDLRVAALNIERARALYRIQRSEQFPGLGAMGTGSRVRIPEKRTDDGEPTIASEYAFQVGISAFELDLFGRVRSLKRRALEQYFATEQARSAAQIALVGAVGHAYLALAADRENLRLALATFDAQADYCGLIGRSRQMGVASDLDLRQAESQREASRLDAARYQGLVEMDRNALHLLVGVPVPDELLPEGLSSVAEPKAIGAGLPSEVLLRRPDILAAEHQLLATNANIGAARAAFFPRISLTLGGGTMSSDLSDLFGSGTGTWMFAPQILAPLYASGLQMANYKAAKVDREIAVARYEQAIQTAFREVADALALRSSLAAQQEASRALVDALDQTHRLSRARYEAGVDGYLGVLVAQRSLYIAQQGLVTLRMADLANRITLYKMLGGGQ